MGTIARARYIVEETFKWAAQRKVFGKPLIQQPVIRERLGKMAELTQASYSWLLDITYQMCNMPYSEQNAKLGGPIALLKAYATDVGEEVAKHAVHVGGGRAITQSGMGRCLEVFMRTNIFPSVYGGSTSVVRDLGVREVAKRFPRSARL